MGKGKSSKGGGTSKKGNAEPVKKCSCTHPYQCSCGNRPERPSKGHKWDPDTQQWGGKGHRQKGASGQVASTAQADRVTEKGGTTLKSWQKMPTRLLSDLAKKNSKNLNVTNPIYRSVGNRQGGGRGRGGRGGEPGSGSSGSKYRYKLIIPSTKGSEHDIILTPASCVENEEQAKEEAALLGLLYLFPKNPSERALPEPYRSTYLAALKNSQTNPEKNARDAPTKISTGEGQGGKIGSEKKAAANTNLSASLQSFRRQSNHDSGGPILTKAQLSAAKAEKQRSIQARIRKHEAIRNANKPMEVFMSARFRKRIESLLKGEIFLETSNDEEEVFIDESDVMLTYVHQRLVHEGFGSSHVIKAYREVSKSLTSGQLNQDEMMDNRYELTLQYLCVHLEEDQLPLGFDSKAGTLDVVSNLRNPRKGSEGVSGGSYYGLTPKESNAIQRLDEDIAANNEMTRSRAFWKVLCEAASLDINKTCCFEGTQVSEENKSHNIELSKSECEALAAIYEQGDELAIISEGLLTKVSLCLPFKQSKLSLDIHYINGLYPDRLPMVFITANNANVSKYSCGGSIHMQIVHYMRDMAPGSECIFELFGHAQSILQDEEESDGASVNSVLLAKLNIGNAPQTSTRPNTEKRPNGTRSQVKKKCNLRRPRERSTFWSTPPSKTPLAESFPKLPAHLSKARAKLPAAKARADFFSLLSEADASGRVLLVTGETGCGKTTQIPQFILENSPNESKIIVAQPRRLAATGVAGRVSLERGEASPGTGTVGYVVRGDSKVCAATRLLFCTTGVLLRQLQSQNALENVSHIVIDEVHERHLDTDILLAILKKTLSSLPNLTVVLMSATMDADRFAAYWGRNTPRMHIPGFTYPVQDFTLEDVLEMTAYIPPRKKKRGFRLGRHQHHDDEPENCDDEDVKAASSGPTECVVPLEERLKRMDENDIDYDLIAVLLRTLLQTKRDDGSILVFLPGVGEIDRAEKAINQILRGYSIAILPLHGGLQPDRQQQVFVPAKGGYTKIILSTNVAETSITIPDCTIVIDTCKEKQSSFDPINRMPLLLEKFASRDSLKQRRGRAGRVQAGTCYKLITKSSFNKLPEHGIPEIQRCALDQTILSLMFLGLEDGSGNFLRFLLDPPSDRSVESAFESLEQLCAISREDRTSSLTPLGKHLAGIPAPPTVGKMLIYGCLLGCRDIAVATSAALSVGRSPWLRINTSAGGKFKDDVDQEKRDKANECVLKERAALFETVGKSDHAMLGHAFMLWKECKGAERRRFCDRLGLAFNSMRDILQLTKQLDSSLTASGFLPSNECNVNAQYWRIVRSVVVASLSPGQVVRVQRPSTKYTENVQGSIEKMGQAKELKFYIRGGDDDSTRQVEAQNRKNEERVFIHPSSSNFSIGNYSCPWLVYFRLVRTSKAFISDATECNPYSLLLFGGPMEVQASKGLIVLDDRVPLAANARIGSLIGGLRQKVDELLEKKVAEPRMDIVRSTEMELITDLIKHDGV